MASSVTAPSKLGRPLRVAMIAFAPHYHTTRWANALLDAGVDVHLVCASSGQDYRVRVPVIEVQLPKHGLPIVSTAQLWTKALKSVDPDVVYMQWMFARPAMLMALQAQWPLVLTVMGSDVRQETFVSETALERTMRTALLLRSTAITAASRQLAGVVRGYHPELAGRIHIVPFGVDTSVFTPAPEADRPASAPFRIGHFKSDDPLYGRLDLLRAVAPLVAAGEPIELHLAGATGLDRGVAAAWLAEHPDVAAVVHDYGHRQPHQMPDLYRSIDTYVINSFQESFGVAAAEALACGVPVVATRVGGVKTLVRSGDNGILVRSGDVAALTAALRELRDHPQLRRSMGERGRKLIRSQFEWHDAVHQLVGILHGAVAN